MHSLVSPSSSTCAVFLSSGRSPYAHGWNALSTSEEVMFHCASPLVGTPGAYCCCFAIRPATCPSAISFQGVFLSSSRRRASTPPWNGLRDFRRDGFLCFVTQSNRRWLGLLAALAIVSIVAALRRGLGGAKPPSTVKLLTGVARRQPLMVRKAVLRQASSFRQWLLRSHVGAQYPAGAMPVTCVAILNDRCGDLHRLFV